MRYEHIELDISTAACDELLRLLTPGDQYDPSYGPEVTNFANELRARLQHTDPDPWAKQAPRDNLDLVSAPAPLTPPGGCRPGCIYKGDPHVICMAIG